MGRRKVAYRGAERIRYVVVAAESRRPIANRPGIEREEQLAERETRGSPARLRWLHRLALSVW